MAEQDSKKARREAAREERRLAQQEAARAAARARVRNTAIGVVSLGLVGVLVWLAIDNTRTEQISDPILVDRAAAEGAHSSLGCEVLAEDQPLPDSTHYDPATAPPADVLYTDVRPTHSGPHFVQTHPIIQAGASQQLEERSLTHSLEHGSIGAFYDPDQFDQVDALEALSERLNDNGFAIPRAGAGIFVAPYTDPGITSGKALALRAWGQAVDCDGYDEDLVLSFVLEHFGTHGIAPEGNFAPFPEQVLQYGDGEGQETGQDAGGEGEPNTGGEDPATDASESPDASDAPSDEATADADATATDEPTDATDPDASESPTG